MEPSVHVNEGIPMRRAALIIAAVVVIVLLIGVVVGKVFFWKPEIVSKDDRKFALAEEMVKKYPKNYKGYLQVGDYYLQNHKTSEALKWFRDAEKRAPKDETVQFYIGLALAQDKKYDEAIKKMEPLAKTSFNFDAPYYLAAVYYAKGDTKKSIELLNYALKWSPEAADAELMLAKSYYKENNLNAAKEHLNKALQMVPKYPEALDFKKAMDSGAKID